MANVNMKEVHDLLTNFQSSSSTLRESLLDLRNTTKNVASLESFEGKGANAAKNYLNDVHVEMSVNYQDTIDNFKNSLKSSVESFHSQVDTDHSCVIKSGYVKEFKTNIKRNKDKVKNSVKAINKEIATISDITAASKISSSEVTEAYNQTKKIADKLLENLATFSSAQDSLTNLGEGLSLVNASQGQMSKVSSSKGGVSSYSGSLKSSILGNLKEGKKYRKWYKLAQKAGKVGYYGYTFVMGRNVNNTYAKYVMSGKKLSSFLGYKLTKDWSKTKKYRILQYSNGTITKEGKNIFKQMGFLDGDPYLLKNATGLKTKATAIGRATQKGLKNGFKIADFKGYKELSKAGKVLKGSGTVLSVAATGLSAYDNFNDARQSGLSKGKSIVSTVAGTVGDLAVSGVSAQVGMTIGTAIGGPLGAVVGLAAGYVIGKYGGKAMSGVKKGVNYVLKNGVSKSVKDAGKAVSNKVNQVAKSASTAINNVADGLQSMGNWAFG